MTTTSSRVLSLDVSSTDGDVLVRWNGGSTFAMTPEEARETGRRLIAIAQVAAQETAAAPEQDNLEDEMAHEIARASKAWNTPREK